MLWGFFVCWFGVFLDCCLFGCFLLDTVVVFSCLTACGFSTRGCRCLYSQAADLIAGERRDCKRPLLYPSPFPPILSYIFVHYLEEIISKSCACHRSHSAIGEVTCAAI